MAKSFRELKVWNLSIELSMSIYRLTSAFPKHEMYGMTSQMRRAAVSIPSNIAEGSARGSRKEFNQFVRVAKGSLCELQTQLIIARRLDYAGSEEFHKIEGCAQEVAQMLSGLSAYLLMRPQSKEVK